MENARGSSPAKTTQSLRPPNSLLSVRRLQRGRAPGGPLLDHLTHWDPNARMDDLLPARMDVVTLASTYTIPARVWQELVFHFKTGTNRNDKTFSDEGGTETD